MIPNNRRVIMKSNKRLLFTRKEVEATLKATAARMGELGFGNENLWWAVHREAFGLTGTHSEFTRGSSGFSLNRA